MSLHYVAFMAANQEVIVAEFSGHQDENYWPYQGQVENDDPRYVAYIASTMPHSDLLATQSAKLQQATQLAAAQKVALTNRIGTINDAIEIEEVTPSEIAELPLRQAQLLEWKRYAVYLGRVTSQDGWHEIVEWPVQPAEGMDLTVSAVAPDSPQLQ